MLDTGGVELSPAAKLTSGVVYRSSAAWMRHQGAVGSSCVAPGSASCVH